MKKKYTYAFCTRCREEKNTNRTPYCKRCSREYNRRYKERKLLNPNINIEGLGYFLTPIRAENSMVDKNDFLTVVCNILFFYENLTTDICEYNNLPFNTQIELMWKDICEYYDSIVGNKYNSNSI